MGGAMTWQEEMEKVLVFREKIIKEIFHAFGLTRDTIANGAARLFLGPVFRYPAAQLGRICARAEEAARTLGITGSARRILPDFSMQVSARGTEKIPHEGPLLVVSNHPGGLDSVALLSSIPRKDVNVVISDVPFTRAFEAAGRHFVYTPRNPAGRMAALKASVGRLKQGEALLIFPHGEVEPDPEICPPLLAAAAVAGWSRSVELMLRKVPDTRLITAIASGVVLPRYARSRLTKIRRSAARRQKVAEVMQFVRQAFSPGSVKLNIRLSFADPVEGRMLLDKDCMPTVIAMARSLLADHISHLHALAATTR
jgi:hypothetical protein